MMRSDRVALELTWTFGSEISLHRIYVMMSKPSVSFDKRVPYGTWAFCLFAMLCLAFNSVSQDERRKPDS